MRYQIEEHQIKIYDPLLIRSLSAYKNTGAGFGTIPKTLGAMRELFALTKDEETGAKALEMLKMSKRLQALKESEIAPLMYPHKPITEDMNEYGKWNSFFKSGKLALTKEQNIDVHFGVEVLKTHGTVFYFDEPRTGKTMKTIATMDCLNARKVIVAQLGGVLEQFKDNIEDWQQIDREVITLSGSVSKAKREAIWDRYRESEDPMVIVASYETLKNDIDYYDGVMYDMLVCDEPHKKIKNARSGNYKAIHKISRSASYIVMLTGTPLDNLLAETYVYLSIAFPKMFKNKLAFNMRYFDLEKNIYAKNAPATVIGWNHRKWEIIETLGSIATNRKNLQKRPEIEYINIPLSPRQEDIIDQIKYDGEFKLDKKQKFEIFDPILEQKRTVTKKYYTIESALTARSLIRQSLVGVSAIKGIIEKLPSNKLKYILRFIRSNPQSRTLIFTDHKTFIKKNEKFFKALGIKYAVIHGEINSKKRDAIRAKLNSGKIQVVIGQILTMSTGGTFNEAENVFFLNLPYNPSEMRQASDRLLDFTDEKNKGKRVMVLQHPGTEDIEQRLTLDDKRKKQSVVNNFESKIQKLKGGK